MSEVPLYGSVWGSGCRVQNFEDSRDGKGYLLPGGANDARFAHAGVFSSGFRVQGSEKVRGSEFRVQIKGHLLPGGANDARVAHAGAAHRRCRTFTCPAAWGSGSRVSKFRCPTTIGIAFCLQRSAFSV